MIQRDVQLLQMRWYHFKELLESFVIEIRASQYKLAHVVVEPHVLA